MSSKVFHELHSMAMKRLPRICSCDGTMDVEITAQWINDALYAWHNPNMGLIYTWHSVNKDFIHTIIHEDREFIFNNLILLPDEEWKELQNEMLRLINSAMYDNNMKFERVGWVRELDTIRAFG